MRNKVLSVATCLALILAGIPAVHAGGALETFNITGLTPSPIAGHVLARVIGIRWDTRCIPVQYSMNNTLNPIPNPLGPAFLSLADATAATQASLDAWNQIPTSFIQMNVTGTVANPGLRGFDFVNEVTFRTAAGFGAIASSPSVSFIQDVNLAPGNDIDGDGDSDVSAGISVATDTDDDGDIEFPAGFYKAGTILDNDVQYNTKVSNGFRFTVDPAAADIVTRSVDYIGVAVHEFGHSFGLSHTLNNQSSASDGNGATMFPFIDTGDPAAELAQRTPDIDDIAWASFFYPEGTASSGPAALQPGDTAFDEEFGLIRGELRHGLLNQPVAGGSVVAIDRNSGVVKTSGFSGTTQLSFNRSTGGLFFLPNVADGVLDGKYVIPVPKGNYQVSVEAVDGLPVAASSISFTTQIGTFYGQQNFNEEFYNRNKEGAFEVRPGQDKNVHVNPGKTNDGIDITTNRSINISNFGNRNFVGFVNSPAGRIYAVRVPASQLAAVNPGEDILIQSAAFDTFVTDASVPVVFAEALLTTGTVDLAGNVTSLDLFNPLEKASGFLGQDGDFAPFFFKNPHELGRRVRRGIAEGEIENLFMVLQIPTTTPFPGVSGQAPLIGLDGCSPQPCSNDVPIFGLSYFSNDGGATWIKTAIFNFRFSLVLSETPPHP